MTFTHDTGLYNVHGSFIAWLQGQLLSNVAPAVGTAIYINLDHPSTPLNPPDISAYWLGAWDDAAGFAGAQVTGGKRGKRRWEMCEVDIWVSRKAAGWRKQRDQLADTIGKALSQLLASGGAIAIYDFYTSESTPSTTGYTLHVTEVETKPTAPDPNPDIERLRLQITLWWIERV